MLPSGLPRGRLLLETAGTIALNVTALVLNFVLVLLLSHGLGASGFGAYASAFAWAGVLAVVAVLGLAPLVVREVATHSRAASWGLLRGVLRWSNLAVAAASAVTVAGAVGAGLAIYHGRPQLLHPFLIGLALVPLIALTSLRQAAMQGLGRVVAGRLPETVLAPGLFVCAVGVTDVAGDGDLSPNIAVALQVGATLASFVAGAWLLRRVLPGQVGRAPVEYDRVAWRRSAVALLLLNVVMAANAQVGTIMLGAISNAGDAGVFNVAFRVTTLISFVLLAASYPLYPRVARLHAAGERQRLEQLVVRAARLVLLVSVPLALVLVVFTEPVLSVFGSGFGAGANAVRIMTIGDLVNVLTGYGGLVLVMSGRESDLTRSALLGAVLNIGLAAVLIPGLGVDGAAIAVAVSLAASNLAMTWYAWRKLGVWAGVVAVGRPGEATPSAR